MSDLPPLRREVVVPAPAAVAFDIWADEIGQWWPLADFSVHGSAGSVRFVDQRLVEYGPSDDQAVWGEVLLWEPPHRMIFTWHPGADASKATEVEVTFTPIPDGTGVVLEHRGWERLATPEPAWSEYEHGWPAVLACYQAKVKAAAAAPDQPATWVALMHRPGPNAPTEGSLRQVPDFREHLAFLGRMQQRGWLVAAGPLPDDDGAGMTVLRVPGEYASEEALATVGRLATEDDQSVVRGLLSVTVRPWRVMLTGR